MPRTIKANETSDKDTRPAVSACFEDGRLVELLYDPTLKETSFAVSSGGAWSVEQKVTAPDGSVLVPYSGRNNLIENKVVLLPSEPLDYGSVVQLHAQVAAFIHRYVDVSPRFERLAAHYVLLSWVYDRFNELPYLRLRGDFGSGKTRFLLTVGALCNKPLFGSGASTVSPIFHTLDAFRGTLVLDEGDFRFSDEKAEMVKILNNGNVKGMPVLRTEVSRHREFNPRAFHVFGPKVVAARGSYNDRALESRFVTEEMRGGRLRDDIPISLSSEYEDEARGLRNRLLHFRFCNYARFSAPAILEDTSIEPRLRQIFAPLVAVADDPFHKEELHWLAREYSEGLASDRSLELEAQVLRIIHEHIEAQPGRALRLKDIHRSLVIAHASTLGPLSPKAVGVLVRQRLGLSTKRIQGNFVVPTTEFPKLPPLYMRYGVIGGDKDAVDKVDLGDFEPPKLPTHPEK